MTSVQQLKQTFGVPFQQQPDITALRQFHANNTFCENEDGEIIGLCACENEFETIQLPASLTQHLEYLNLSDNPKLRHLTFEGSLPVLKHLDISDSKVEVLSLPPGMEVLDWLDVSRNQLKALNFSGQLPCLRYLDLSDNQVTTLTVPDGRSLQYLYAQKNRLSECQISPAATKLEVLHLKENQLEALPASILSLTSLEALYVYGNPLSSLPQSSIAEGENASSLENIRNYLLSITQDDTIANDEIKLVLLGNSTAGKSSLLRFLIKGKYERELSSTHGIQNKLWILDNGSLKVNVWDFGGQEFYHATHRLFLSNNAVNLIVFESATNLQAEIPTKIKLYHGGELQEHDIALQHFPFSYWLDSLQHFCSRQQTDSTVLVQTKMDRADTKIIPVSDTDKKKYQLPEERIFRISVEGASDKIKRYVRSFEAFKEDLEDILHEVKSTYKISTKWLAIKEELRTIGQKQTMLSYEDYVALCERISPGISQSRGADKQSMLDTLTEYLDGISVMLYYPDIKALQDVVFINPEWITNIIYKVLDYEVKEHEGKFAKSHIEHIINKDERAGALGVDQLIALMQQFELIFQLKNEPDQFIAAQYLPKENPEQHSKAYKKIRNSCNQHAFTLRYPVFMPRSAITRLICRYGNLAEDIFWRNGIVFEKDCTTVHLECNQNREVRVDMDSLLPAVVSDIFNNMEDINRRHPDLEVSINGADFVQLAALKQHPVANPQIQSTSGHWLPIEDFHIIMGRHGTKPLAEVFPDKSTNMDQIHQLVGKGRLEKALTQLEQLAPAHRKDEVTQIKRQLNDLNRDSRMGILTRNEESVSRNKITISILQLAGSLKEETPVEPEPTTTVTTSPLRPIKNNPPKVFISYAHKDDSRYARLFVDGISVHSDWKIFQDRQILIGEDWHERLQREVQECDFAIFLLSPYFFRSEYIQKHEFEEFVQRNRADGFPFFSVLLADCNFQQWESIAKRQIFVAHGQDYDLAKSHRDRSISFDLLARFDRDGELIPNPYLNTFYKNFVAAVNKALSR